MFCKYCGANCPDEAEFCATCGKKLNETPVEEAPIVETPVEEVPTAEAPVEETPVVEAPVVEAKKTNVLGIVSLVLGILSVLGLCCCTYLGVPLGIAAAITGFISNSKEKNTMAIVGLVLGIIGTVLCIAYIILVAVAGLGSNIFEELMY